MLLLFRSGQPGYDCIKNSEVHKPSDVENFSELSIVAPVRRFNHVQVVNGKRKVILLWAGFFDPNNFGRVTCKAYTRRCNTAKSVPGRAARGPQPQRFPIV